METNDTNNKIVYPELSYVLNGLLFKTHNSLGRFCREKRYGDFVETLLKETEIKYEREKELPVVGVENIHTNKADFPTEGKIVLELKAKAIVTKEDYCQMNRYLDAGGQKLGMIVNFRNKYLRPIRVIRANS